LIRSNVFPMPRPPDIIWIVTTQWRAQAFGHAGDPNARTPSIDAFASKSVNFTQAVTPHPFGPFARAALLTGVPSPENGVTNYFDPLPPGARTIAHRLAGQGYTTGFIGKWHLARRDPAAALVGEAHARMVVPPGERGGFDFWEGFEGGFQLNNPWLHGSRLPEPVRFEGYQSDVLCRRAADWMKRASRPFFCVVSLEAPHPPYDAPAAGIKRRRPADLRLASNVPRGGPVEERARRELAGYHAHIEATDRAIGGLIATEAAREGVVAFTSVHGDMHGAHGLFRKGWPHEESVRVPLIVRAARGGDRRGEASAAPVSLIDLPQWTMGWSRGETAVPPPSPLPPTSAARISMPSVVALPYQCDRAWRGIRTSTQKLVLNGDGTPWLYFNLKDDPHEMRNLADSPSHAPEIAALRGRV